MALYGKSYDTDPEMIDKGVQMVQFMRTYCDELKAETNIGFSSLLNTSRNVGN